MRYIISDADAPNAEARVRAIPFLTPDTPYDTGKYLELLCRAVETLLWHHGYECERLHALLVERGIVATARGQGIADGDRDKDRGGKLRDERRAPSAERSELTGTETRDRDGEMDAGAIAIPDSDSENPGSS